VAIPPRPAETTPFAEHKVPLAEYGALFRCNGLSKAQHLRKAMTA
jgi:hypothetical protein